MNKNITLEKRLNTVPISLSVSKFFVEKRRNVSNGLRDDPALLRYTRLRLRLRRALRTIGLLSFFSLFANEPAQTLSNRAAVVITSAEQAIKREDFAQARDLLCTVTSWPLETTPTLFRLGIQLIQLGEFQTAVATFKRILQREPHNVSALYNSGFALKNDDHVDEAIACYKTVLALCPTNEQANLALGYAYLHNGDFAKGWPQHEHYLKKANKYAPELRALLANNSLAGKRILLTPEGGLGDTINFISAAQKLKARGAYIIAYVQKPLKALLQRCTFLDEVIDRVPASLRYDARVTYMSLPAALYLDETAITPTTPYVFADQTLIDWWHEQVAADTNFKIGICWQADRHNDESRLPVARRSIPIELLAQLGTLPGVSLYSLQTESHNGACHVPAVDGLVRTFTFAIDTDHGAFMDTAALMMNMDLIVSVDTATPNLAGALGKPVWLLLPYATDWRWIAHRTDSPWYPTMRIFKQSKPFDWESVIGSVMEELPGFALNVFFQEKIKSPARPACPA